jgi:hypothetical protein
MASRSISFSSILLSYFLVAGGIALGIVLFAKLGGGGQPLFYAMLALGGLIGGFVAGRGSRGTTVIEPAIGGVLVIASMAGIFVGTEVGGALWSFAQDEVIEIVGLAAAAAAAGAIAGAVLSDKLLAGYAQGSLEWLVLVAFTILGACIVAFIAACGVAFHGTTDSDTLAGVYMGAMAGGSLLAGLAVGASAPRRILLLTLIGAVAGVMGFYLVLSTIPTMQDEDGKVAAGFAIIGVLCGVIALIGAAIGWRLVGRRHSREIADQARAFT